MANPTYDQLTGIEESAFAAVLAALYLPSTSDPRLAIQQILSHLVGSYNAVFAEASPLTTYSASLNRNNIDIDTQRQTFMFTVDMTLVPAGVDNEPTI